MELVTTADQNSWIYCLDENTVLTLGGLRILSIGGVCLLKVIAGSEGRNEFYFLCSFHRSKKKPKKLVTPQLAFNFIFDTALTHTSLNRACVNPTHSSVSPTWSSVAHPCSSGDRRAAAGRAAPASPRQKHSAAPAAAHSSPPGPQTQAHPGGGREEVRTPAPARHLKYSARELL